MVTKIEELKETKCKDCMYKTLCPALVGKTEQIKNDNVFCDTFKLDKNKEELIWNQK